MRPPLLAAFLFLTMFIAGPLMAADQPPIVIIHGAWGGAHQWKPVAHALTHDHGRSVRRAELTGLGWRSHLASREVTLDTHIRDVVNLIEFDDLKRVVLIGHSYGGLVAQGVVNEIPKRVSRVFYLDTNLLDDGETYLTHHPEWREKYVKRAEEDGDGFLIPVDWPNPMRDVPHPLATLTQPIKLNADTFKAVRASYWLFADGKPVKQDDRFRYYQRALDRGWDARAFSWGHNPQRERPEDLVTDLVKELQ